MHRKFVQNNTTARLGFYDYLYRRSSSTRANKYINEFICPRPPHSTRIYIAFTVHWFHHDRFPIQLFKYVTVDRLSVLFARKSDIITMRYGFHWIQAFSHRCTSRSKYHSKKIAIVRCVLKNILIVAHINNNMQVCNDCTS